MAVLDAGGSHLRLTVVPNLEPAGWTVAGWSVPGIEAVATDLAGRGIERLRYDGMDQDDLGIWTAPGGDRVSWFHDPDRNVLSITEFAHRPSQ